MTVKADVPAVKSYIQVKEMHVIHDQCVCQASVSKEWAGAVQGM